MACLFASCCKLLELWRLLKPTAYHGKYIPWSYCIIYSWYWAVSGSFFRLSKNFENFIFSKILPEHHEMIILTLFQIYAGLRKISSHCHNFQFPTLRIIFMSWYFKVWFYLCWTLKFLRIFFNSLLFTEKAFFWDLENFWEFGNMINYFDVYFCFEPKFRKNRRNYRKFSSDFYKNISLFLK